MSLEYPSSGNLSGRWELSEIHKLIRNNLWPTSAIDSTLNSCERCNLNFGSAAECLPTGLIDAAVGSVAHPSGDFPPSPLELQVGRRGRTGIMWHDTPPLMCFDRQGGYPIIFWSTLCAGTGIIADQAYWNEGEIAKIIFQDVYYSSPISSISSSGIILKELSIEGSVECTGLFVEYFLNQLLPWRVRWRRLYEDWTLDEGATTGPIGKIELTAYSIGMSGIANGISGWDYWNNIVMNITGSGRLIPEEYDPGNSSYYQGIIPIDDPAWNNFTLHTSFLNELTSSGCYWFPYMQKISRTIPANKYAIDNTTWTLENSSDAFYGTINDEIYIKNNINAKLYAEKVRIDIIKYCPSGCTMEIVTDTAISGVNNYVYSGVTVGTYLDYGFLHRKSQLSYTSSNEAIISTTYDPDTYCDCSPPFDSNPYLVGTTSTECSSFADTLWGGGSFFGGTCYFNNASICAIKKGFARDDIYLNSNNCNPSTEYDISACNNELTITESGCTEYCGDCLLGNMEIYINVVCDCVDPFTGEIDPNPGTTCGTVVGQTDCSQCDIDYFVSALEGTSSDYIWKNCVAYDFQHNIHLKDGNIDFIISSTCGSGTGIINAVNAAGTQTECSGVASTYSNYYIEWNPGDCCGTNFYNITSNTAPILDELGPPCFNYSKYCPVCSSNITFSGTIQIDMIDICRTPDPTAYAFSVGEIEYVTLANCGECDLTGFTIHELSDANHYETSLIGSEWGVPIDIDQPCNSDYINKDTFTLYFSARYGNRAVPVVSGVWYDTSVFGSTDLFRITTQNSPQRLRQWVCSNLRFATKNGSALVYNWPYNDLYWSYCDASTDVPINLVPC